MPLEKLSRYLIQLKGIVHTYNLSVFLIISLDMLPRDKSLEGALYINNQPPRKNSTVLWFEKIVIPCHGLMSVRGLSWELFIGLHELLVRRRLQFRPANKKGQRRNHKKIAEN